MTGDMRNGMAPLKISNKPRSRRLHLAMWLFAVAIDAYDKKGGPVIRTALFALIEVLS